MTEIVERIRLRKNELYLQHPDPSPLPVHPVDYLIHPPSRLAPTTAFLDFRDNTLGPMMRDRPDDRNLPRYSAAVEEILAWRATIPAELRFWRGEE